MKDAPARLAVHDLHIRFFARDGVYRVLNGTSLDLYPGEILGLIGETGSGKSLTLRAILNLVPRPGRVVSGEIVYEGQNLLTKSASEMRQIHGREIALVVQNARAALNPFLTVGQQIANVYRAHASVPERLARARAVEMLAAVQLADPERCAASYAHELSGGMAQRALIAMALVSRPKVLLADEPTTGLDVTIQAQILRLLHGLVKDGTTSAILVTHDLGLVSRYCDRIAVMFAGRIVECASVPSIFARPSHPYTISLLESLGRAPLAVGAWPPRRPLSLLNLPRGCHFQARCPWTEGICREQDPPELSIAEGHSARCHLSEKMYVPAH
jgi:oligopeptide/dipeptide ABC transporter ATP-binding protein